MNNILPDIPRLYTALAEWSACITYLLSMNRRVHGWKFAATAICVLIIQSITLILTSYLPIGFWIPSMAVAAMLMFFFLYSCGDLYAVDAGYCCVRAFILAEFAASLEWQIYCYFWPINDAPIHMRILLLILVYPVVFCLFFWVEKRYTPEDIRLKITQKELWYAIAIGCSIFVISNLSFVTISTPFSGQYVREIFNIRTVVGIGGLAILHAYHIQCCDIRIRQELKSVQDILKNQYVHYQQSKDNIDMINQKYHDLKYLITGLRAEINAGKWNDFLNKMENEIKNYETENKTGNAVLDTLLTSKSMYCVMHEITLTCVANGALLNFMDVMDICTIFGNALDNAIESIEKISDKEKRLIHIAIFSQKDFLVIRFENYYEENLNFAGELPLTTKKDSDFHGYGLKSIRYISNKYGGAMTIETQNNWFSLKILIPMT